MEETKKRTKSTASFSSLAVDWDPWALCGCGRRPQRSRLNRLSVFPTKTSDRKKSTPKTSLLTGQQRLIVMRTWHKLSVDISALGISTMTRMFYNNPPLAELFNFLIPEGSQLQFDPRFRQHAFWLIQAVSAMVENLDDLDLMVSDMFMEIGEKHAAIPNFSPDMFKILPAAWAFVWEEHLRERFTAQTDKSWAKIFNYIVDRLIDGCSDYVVLEEIVSYSPAITTPTATTRMPSVSIDPDSGTSATTIGDEEVSDSDSDDSSAQISFFFDRSICQMMDPSSLLTTEESTAPYRRSSESKSRKQHRKSSNKLSTSFRADQSGQKSDVQKTSEPTGQ